MIRWFCSIDVNSRADFVFVFVVWMLFSYRPGLHRLLDCLREKRVSYLVYDKTCLPQNILYLVLKSLRLSGCGVAESLQMS